MFNTHRLHHHSWVFPFRLLSIHIPYMANSAFGHIRMSFISLKRCLNEFLYLIFSTFTNKMLSHFYRILRTQDEKWTLKDWIWYEVRSKVADPTLRRTRNRIRSDTRDNWIWMQPLTKDGVFFFRAPNPIKISGFDQNIRIQPKYSDLTKIS